MAVLSLLKRARKAGLAFRAEGSRLVVQGPRRAADLARQLGERKDEVLAALERRLDLLCVDDDGPWPTATAPISADLFRVRMAEDLRSSDRHGRPSKFCYACGESTWWRPPSAGTSWFCGRCHPPARSVRNIEWWPGVPPEGRA